VQEARSRPPNGLEGDARLPRGARAYIVVDMTNKRPARWLGKSVAK